MRHNNKNNHLGRQAGHRKAMLANMASSLIMHKRIETTLARAKVLRTYVEPLITKSKDDTTHSRRMVFSHLKDKYAVTELFRNVAPKIADRPGGYTRILKIGFRQGDAAEMAMMELVDFNEAMLASATPKKEVKKTTRRSRAAKKTDDSAEPKTTAKKAKAAEAKVEEVEAKVEEQQPEAPTAEVTETPAEE
ncbi:MAG: 50S ribosomal protein L17 [Prevotellaceae bacterium]|jgi:large subunit ribosomal protein L17|nr:50S ribosomal protein L17 [Prevotellaceae bacterium]